MNCCADCGVPCVGKYCDGCSFDHVDELAREGKATYTTRQKKTIELIRIQEGVWAFVGNTYPIMSTLKQHGCRWNPREKVWMLEGSRMQAETIFKKVRRD